MSQPVAWAIQVLILGTGIYFALRFLRTTRGGGILRGLAIALAFGSIVLWSVTAALGLEELGHILESIAGFVVVILVILFQPELRRGIAQLGEHPLLGRLLAPRRSETIGEVAQAVIALSKRRHGALIAFERDTSLEAYLGDAVRMDAHVTRYLLESIFHPGGALHDGAVVVRRERVLAATCLFPLTESAIVGRSIGTRHRAAIGLTEETDAATLVVSEETGAIAVCRHGAMQHDVAPERLEELLQAELGSPARPDRTARSFVERLRSGIADLFTYDVGRKAAAFGIAIGLLYLAHRDIHVARDFTLQIVERGRDAGAPVRPGELAIRLPSDGYRLLAPAPGTLVEVEVSGTRGRVDALGPLLSGEIAVAPEMAGIGAAIDLEQVFWGGRTWTDGLALSAEWKSDPPPQILFERQATRSIALGSDHLRVEAIGLDARFRPDLPNARFDPAVIEVAGPEAAIAALGSGELPFALEAISLGAEDTAYHRTSLGIAPELAAQRIAISGAGLVRVTLPIVDALRPLGSVEKEIQVVFLDPSRQPSGLRYALPAAARTARLSIQGVGILAAEPGSAEWLRSTDRLREIVRAHLSVFADASAAALDAGRRVEVRWILRDDWRDDLEAAVGPVDERSRLELVLESEPEILLQVEKTAESSGQEAARGGRD